MAISQFITADQLRAQYAYDPETGVFTSRKTGRTTGSVNDRGYVRIRIGRRLCKAHRMAWLYMTGEWPPEQIDHINGDRADNRWANLRAVDGYTNMQNQRRAQRHNKVGLLGVQKTRNGKFKARINVRWRRFELGTFETAEEAHAAYMAAKRIYHAAAVNSTNSHRSAPESKHPCGVRALSGAPDLQHTTSPSPLKTSHNI